MYTMIWNQEAFLPSHEDGTPVPVCHGEMGAFELMSYMFEGGEAGPVDHIILFRGTPVLCQETVTASDDFGIEECGQFWPVVCQTTNAEVAT
jgi:hypothetical protein